MLFTYIIVRGTFSLGDNKSLAKSAKFHIHDITLPFKFP